jgi:ABC-type Zn uptake system ZnuABC Zn-binding protein ZnuA
MDRHALGVNDSHSGWARRAAAAVVAVVALACAGLSPALASGADAAPAAGAAAVGAEVPRIDGPALAAVVTVPALKSFVEPLLPAGSTVKILMQPGRSEHGYEFTPTDLRALAQADVVVYVGLGLEPQVAEFLERRKDSSRRVIVFADAVGIEMPEGHEHSDPGHVHGPGCNHGPVDQHLWLDPVLCAELVPSVRRAVEQELVERKELTVDRREALKRAEDSLRARIMGVDAAWREGVKAFAGKAIITHHNAFGRPAERYGFEVAEVIHANPTVEPSPAEIAAVAKAVREQRVGAIFIEPQFNPAVAERIAKSADARIGRLDPLGTGDWFALMEQNLRSLRTTLAPETATEAGAGAAAASAGGSAGGSAGASATPSR